MLYLHPPFYYYEGVSLAGDYHDPSTFYFWPNRPHLAVDDQDRPAIRFIVFREDLDAIDDDDESAVGFLTFDTSLAWPEETLDKVARKLENDLELETTPRLVPLPYRGGTVRLMFLDRSTTPPSDDDDPSAPPEAAEQPWVSVLETSGVPSLYGENRAIFSAMLTKKAATLLFGAFEGFMPAGVVYDLSYVGMQRAFNVKVEADWERVYHHLSEKFSLDLVFVNVNTADILDELEEAQLIRITASLEGVGDEAMEEEFNAVRKELQAFMLETFFKPVANAHQQDVDAGASEGLQTARSVINMIHHWPTAGYSRVELNTSQIRSLDIDYTVARAVERRIAPQAHLSLFFEDFAITRDQVVTVVDGKDALWEELEFELALNADFARDGIHSVAMDVLYGELPPPPGATDPASPEGATPADLWSFLFDGNSDRVKKAAWYDPAIGNRFHYRYAVQFKPDALPGAHTSLSSGWREQDGQLVVVSPNELYRSRRVEVLTVANFPFERYPQIFLQMRYTDPASGWRHEDAALLSASQPTFTFAFRSDAQAPQTVEYRLGFLAADGERLEHPAEPDTWLSSDSDLIPIDDPVPDDLVVRVLVAGDRSKVLNLIVDLKYEDPANGVHESQAVIIDQSNIHETHLWRVPLVDRNRRRYAYSQTLIDADGNVIQTGWQQEEKTTLTVGDVFVKVMEVHPELIGPPLDTHQLELIKLNLHYEDAANAQTLDKQMVFSQPGRGETWRLQLKDASARDYSYEVVYVMNTGFERRVGPISARDNFLVVSSVPPGNA